MRSIVGIIGILATIYFGAPKVSNLIYKQAKSIAVKQIDKPMTSMTSLAKKLTSEK